MSNDAQAIDRLFKLQAKINMMVLDGTRDAGSVADVLQQILVEKREYLRHLETATLALTKGDVTLAKAKDVFTGWLDGDFKSWGTNVPGGDTDEAAVDVFEMIHDGKFQTLFGSLGDPRKLALSQGQIVEFCRNHRSSLRQEGYGTFFLFEVNDVLFVALVFVVDGKLKARVFRFGNGIVRSAVSRHRLVVKQQIDRLFKLRAKINMMVLDGTRDAGSVADVLQQILVEKREYLRHLETATLALTKGDVTLAKAKDVFTGWLDGDFKGWGTNVPGGDTDEAAVDVFEMIHDGKFQTLFGSLGDPRKLALSQGQIVEFCRNHRSSLRQEGYGTFFLFEVNDVLFVAGVSVDDGELEAGVFRFGLGLVWPAGSRHRLVVKQQTV